MNNSSADQRKDMQSTDRLHTSVEPQRARGAQSDGPGNGCLTAREPLCPDAKTGWQAGPVRTAGAHG